jgi:uncharacterized protein involved in exopolysaccharide biosynthesis/Mrp family chromosome partitioning ATPase
MQQRPTTPPPTSTLTISDVYHVLFKRKWMILLFSLAGIIGAVGLYFKAPPPYASEAKLLIRYVEDTKALTASTDAQVRQVDSRGEGVLDTEASILMSLDIAATAAEAVGVDRVLGKGRGMTNREAAAAVIHSGLTVDVPKRGNVLRVSFQHPDGTIVQPVLRSLIQTYYKKHLEIHKNLGVVDEFLTQETDQLRQALNQTEEDLRKLKSKAGVVSLEEARKGYLERYTKLRDDLERAEADLSERRGALRELQRTSLLETEVAAAQTNIVTEPKPKIPTETLSEYRRLVARLDAAFLQQQELMGRFTEENALVKESKKYTASLEAQKKEMETKTPLLKEEAIVLSPIRAAEHRDTRIVDVATQSANVAALEARVKTLQDQFERLKADAGAVDEIETRYLELQRKKELQETQYKNYSRSLDQARIDSQLGAGKLSNISEIQAPSAPVRDLKAMKKLAVVMAGGIGGGLGLAFLLEVVLSQVVRKPGEIESVLNIPVFLSIPWLNNFNVQGDDRRALPPASDTDNADAASPNGNQAIATRNGHPSFGDQEHVLHGYSEGLRDRLVTFFEAKGLKHKPKLIALTSCSRGAGVTTLAAGLAASLSETGEGNVLLVDLNVERGAAHPFYRGKPACGLADVLEKSDSIAAKVQENLYLVHGGGGDDRLSKVVPNRLAHLLPKLQQSDYDYIIFDMPPISQTSVTPRLAAFMDMVFLVVEAEKTNRDWLKQANSLLKQSNANVGAVLNKRREYTPRWLHQEF